jgi:ABC-type multidrug transport system fused ATPase/permease subunit
LVLIYGSQLGLFTGIVFQLYFALFAFVPIIDQQLKFSSGAREDYDLDGPGSNWPQNGKIEFKNITIRYGKHLKPVVNNFNLKILAGSKVGIVGRTGWGKSTVLRSLLRLVDYNGVILIDGIDITSMGVQHLRRAMATMLQESSIFSGSILENIDPKSIIPRSEIEDLAESFGITEDLNKNVKELGEGGKQVVSVIRNILKKRKILLQDESTSSLDATQQAKVLECLQGLDKDAVVSIAHKLDSLVFFNKLAVLEQGALVDYGAPADLCQNEKSFLFKLVNDWNTDGRGGNQLEFKRDTEKCAVCYQKIFDVAKTISLPKMSGSNLFTLFERFCLL